MIIDAGVASMEPRVLMIREARAGVAHPRLALPGGKRIASDEGRAAGTAAREMREELGEALAECVLSGSVRSGVDRWEKNSRCVWQQVRARQ